MSEIPMHLVHIYRKIEKCETKDELDKDVHEIVKKLINEKKIKIVIDFEKKEYRLEVD